MITKQHNPIADKSVIKAPIADVRFGTDGIRGIANGGVINCDMLMRLGMVAGYVMKRENHIPRIVIGKDTRLSGYMIESSLIAGLSSAGAESLLLGPLPTPAVALLMRSLRADLGIMITASHNPYCDNGVKFFSSDGGKLSDSVSADFERMMHHDPIAMRAAPERIGRARRIDDASARYIEFVKQGFPRGLTLDGMRIVLDCAHGAAYKVAPTLLWELGAEVIKLGVEPDGLNINRDCGSLHPEHMAVKIREYRADIGIALDGDADRVVFCDETGTVIMAEQILAAIAMDEFAATKDRVGSAPIIVTTEIANLALDHFLGGAGIEVVRVPVGDRYVIEQMQSLGAAIGGEPSGHFIVSDNLVVSDGLMAALRLLGMIRSRDCTASSLCRQFTPLPYYTANIPCTAAGLLGDSAICAAIGVQRRRLTEAHRGAAGETKAMLIARGSGTEPVIRVIAQGEDDALVREVIAEVASIVEAGIG